MGNVNFHLTSPPPQQSCYDRLDRIKMSATTKVGNANQKSLLSAVAAVLRILLVLAFPGLPDLLTGRVEVSTPVNSFKRCRCTRTGR